MVNQANNRFKVNFKLKTFLIFLFLSTLFWVLIKLSKTYTSDVIFNVDYKNLPIEKVVQNDPVNEIEASIESTGFDLLRYKLKHNNIIFDLSKLAYKKGNDYYYLPNNNILELRKQLNVETEIKRFSLDTIHFKLGFNKKKKIPVILDSEIHFKLGYNFVESLSIFPDSVVVVGPEVQLDTINSIKTKKINLIDVSSKIEKEVLLDVSNYKHIVFSEDKIQLNAEVDKFTEGSLKVPFKINNLPDNYQITTFPSEVNVVYKVALSNFNKITPDDFEIICDYNEALKNNVSHLIPKFKHKSILITSAKITPNKIEFLIQEK
jgi:hypothetical protein